MNKYIRKLIVLSAISCISFSGMQISEARVNPYSNVEVMHLSDEAKADYIDKKMDTYFNSAKVALNDEYVVPEGWSQEKLSFNGVPVEKYTANNSSSDRILLFMHGGGYVGGLNNRYRDWAIHHAELAGNATLLVVDYRIAPKHLYPSALEDAVNAYKGILSAGYNPSNMVLMGDSAGGNLSLSLAVYLKDHDIAQPKATVLISPWTYLGNELPSHKNNLEKDKILGTANKALVGEIKDSTYGKGKDKSDPYLSPAYADLEGVSPILIIAGGDELLLDDTALISAHAKASNVKVIEKIYPKMSHDWSILLPELPESKDMDKAIADFIDENL